MAEKYSLENAENEAFDIRNKALEVKAKRGEQGEPSGKDYGEAEREVVIKNNKLAGVPVIAGQCGTTETREQLKELVEIPLLAACEELYDKNIQTSASSANLSDIEKGEVSILINFDTLSEENKKIAERVAKILPPDGGWSKYTDAKIAIPVSASSTIDEISKKALEIVSAFRKQKATWIPTFKKVPKKIEEMRDDFYGPEDPEYSDPTADGWRRQGFVYDPEKKVFFGADFFDGRYYYDETEDTYYYSEEHCKKAHEKIEEEKVSGLDMEKTLNWYAQAVIEMPSIPEADFPCDIENKDLLELSDRELGGLLALFPENARKRSILKKIVGQPNTWFHKDSISGQPRPTTDKEESLSPTAIIPSYIDYTPWQQSGVPEANIWLYAISKEAAPEKVRKIVLTEGFVHEIGHSIVQPAVYIGEYNLRFPDGRIINGLEAVLHFAELAEKHPPISHYASVYRGDNNKFESKDPNYNVKTAISEELCESIAAYLLGFAYCGDDSRGKDPFADRPEIRDFIRDFLNAELVKGE